MIPIYLSLFLFVHIINEIYKGWVMNPVRGVLTEDAVDNMD
jgi:hypothetical protein